MIPENGAVTTVMGAAATFEADSVPSIAATKAIAAKRVRAEFEIGKIPWRIVGVLEVVLIRIAAVVSAGGRVRSLLFRVNAMAELPSRSASVSFLTIVFPRIPRMKIWGRSRPARMPAQFQWRHMRSSRW